MIFIRQYSKEYYDKAINKALIENKRLIAIKCDELSDKLDIKLAVFESKINYKLNKLFYGR